MGMQDSPSVGNLLKQVYASHNSMKRGFQAEITKLKQKIANLEGIIARCPACTECGNQLLKPENNKRQHSSAQNDLTDIKKTSCKQKNDKKTSKTTEIRRTVETPSLFDDSWEQSNISLPTLGSSNDIEIELPSKKLKQVTLDRSFCFAVETKNDFPDTSTNDLSPSLLDVNPIQSESSSHSTNSKKSGVDDNKTKKNFKYKAEVTRNREDRAKLEGYGCLMCKEYYSKLNLSEEEIRERMNNCSRHRDNHVPSSTPEHFWEVDFPSTQESKRRGDIRCTQYRPLKTRRKCNLDVACQLFND